jgi:hypothetical protein
MNEIVTQEEGAFSVPENIAAEVNILREGGETEETIKEFIRLNETPETGGPQPTAETDDAPQPAVEPEEPGTGMELLRGLAEGTQRAIDAAGRLVPLPSMEINEQPVENLTDFMGATVGDIGTEYELPTTTTGKVTSGITQTMWGAFPAMKLVKTLGATNVFVQTVVGGAVGDFVVGDEQLAKGMLNLIDALPSGYGGDTADKIVNVIDEWATDPENGGYDDLKARTVTALGGIPLSAAADRLLKVAGIAMESGKESLKAFRDTLSTRLRGTEAPAMVRNADDQSLMDAHSVIGARVSRDGEARKGTPVFSELYRLFVDRFNPIKKLQDELAAGRELPINMRPYEQTRLQVSAMNKANLFLEHEVRNFLTGEVVGPGLKKIMEPLSGDGQGLREFSNYAVAKRALELMDRPKPIKTGYEADRAALEKVVRETGERFEPIFRGVVDYQNNVLNYLKDSGVLSKDMVKAIQEANKDYVPFFRLMDDEGAAGAGGLAKKVFNPLRKIKGSERNVIDPMESIIKNTYAFVQLAERNQVIKSLHDLAKSSPRGAELVKVVPIKSKPIKIKGEELETAIKKADPESDLLDLVKQYAGADAKVLPDDISIFRAMAAPDRANTVSYMSKGKRVTLELDEDVAVALKDMDNDSVSLLTKIFSLPAKALRAGAVLDPEFFVRNAMRDNVTAAVYSANGFKPFLTDFASGFVSLAKKDKHYRDWLNGGGAQATLVSLDRQYLRENLQKLMDSADMYTTVKNVVRSPLEILRAATEFAENATRIGEFKRAMKDGPQTKEAMQEAAFQSREITLDFARRGAATKGMNMLAAFLNARVQGYDRMVRAMVNNPVRTNSRAAMFITTPSILLWMHNNSTEERRKLYRAVPEWQKNLFWVVINEDGEHTRIPKPFELGVLYGSVPERLLDAWAGNRKIADLPHDLVKAVGLDPYSLASSILPTFAQPVLEQMMNYSFFRNRPLEPGSLSDPQTAPLAQDRYTLYTSETAKKISDLFGGAGIPVLENMSPIEVENYIGQWTGGLGRKFIELIVEPTGKALGVLPEENLPAKTLADIPFVKGFVIRHPDRNNQQAIDFYRRSDEAMQWVNSYKKRERELDLDRIKELMNAEGGKARVYIAIEDEIREVRENMSKMSATIGKIYKHPTMDKTEKRVNIDNVLTMMHRYAIMGNEMLDKAEEARKAWESTVGK